MYCLIATGTVMLRESRVGFRELLGYQTPSHHVIYRNDAYTHANINRNLFILIMKSSVPLLVRVSHVLTMRDLIHGPVIANVDVESKHAPKHQQPLLTKQQVK
jgi:hypothetical protein